MPIPQNAKKEIALDDKVVIYNVSALLPAHGTKTYKTRATDSISYIIVHKSGADGASGYKGAQGCANYVVNHRKWAGMPYTFWLSQDPDMDEQGRLVIYRCQPDDIVSWHTGNGMNGIGTAVGVQGDYDGDWDGLIGKTPTDAQWTMIKALVPWLAQKHQIDLAGASDSDEYYLTGHWEHGKSVCPGDALRGWVMKTRGQEPQNVEPSTPQEVLPLTFNTRDRQKALKLLGFYTGNIDGIWGPISRAALEELQKKANLKVDGWFGKNSAKAMLHSLRDRGLADKDAFADASV